jgi:hypothetical protein
MSETGKNLMSSSLTWSSTTDLGSGSEGSESEEEEFDTARSNEGGADGESSGAGFGISFDASEIEKIEELGGVRVFILWRLRPFVGCSLTFFFFLRQGAYGKVWKARIRGSLVAVKVETGLFW